jgi:hypothetical protein
MRAVPIHLERGALGVAVDPVKRTHSRHTVTSRRRHQVMLTQQASALRDSRDYIGDHGRKLTWITKSGAEGAVATELRLICHQEPV